MTITETGISPKDWILFNINETGYYRVNYDSKNWNMLIEYLKDKELYSNIGNIVILLYLFYFNVHDNLC